MALSDLRVNFDCPICDQERALHILEIKGKPINRLDLKCPDCGYEFQVALAALKRPLEGHDRG